MDEYIEKDEAIRKAVDACIKVVGHEISHIDAVDIAEIMDSIPAADVVEVRHGEWLDNGDRDSNGVIKPFAISCSVCGSSVGTSWMRYCPNCGAKMNRKEVT